MRRRELAKRRARLFRSTVWRCVCVTANNYCSGFTIDFPRVYLPTISIKQITIIGMFKYEINLRYFIEATF